MQDIDGNNPQMMMFPQQHTENVFIGQEESYMMGDEQQQWKEQQQMEILPQPAFDRTHMGQQETYMMSGEQEQWQQQQQHQQYQQQQQHQQYQQQQSMAMLTQQATDIVGHKETYITGEEWRQQWQQQQQPGFLNQMQKLNPRQQHLNPRQQQIQMSVSEQTQQQPFGSQQHNIADSPWKFNDEGQGVLQGNYHQYLKQQQQVHSLNQYELIQQQQSEPFSGSLTFIFGVTHPVS
jgi:hypothetical protein